MQYKHIVIITIKQNHLLNGNGVEKLHHGGKDIKVPKYTVKPLEEGDEYEIDCKADELQDYLKNIIASKF